MGYDVHVVRTKDWFDAASDPITKKDVDALIASDPELSWSDADYIDMSDDSGRVTRYFAIAWNGRPCFVWMKDRIVCAGPDDEQLMKLVRMAKASKAHVVGDDGERYELKRSFFGREKLVTIAPED